MISTVMEALQALENVSAGSQKHLEAIRFLNGLDECFEVKNLVKALQNDDFSVRWEAADLLAKIGHSAIPQMLKALMDPERAGDPRLRNGVVRIIHKLEDHLLKKELSPLLAATKSSSADIETMRVAFQLLKKFDPSACDDVSS